MTRMIGVDVSGTFTDVFVLDEAKGTAKVAKVPTTRPDQSGGFLEGIAANTPDLINSHYRSRNHGRHQRSSGTQRRKNRSNHDHGFGRRS